MSSVVDTKYNIYAKYILHISMIAYIASVFIFARPDNVIYSNLFNVMLWGFFILFELLYGDRTIYVNRILITYIIFILFGSLTLFWSLDQERTIDIVKRMILITVNLVILYNILKKYDLISAIFIGMLIGTIANFLLGIGLVEVNFDLYFPETTRFQGTSINPNITASFMLYSMFLSIIYIQINKSSLSLFLSLTNIIFALYVILLTVSRTSLVIASGVLLIFILHNFFDKEKRKYIILITIAIVIFLLYSDTTKMMETINFALKRIGFIFDSLMGEGKEYSANERMELIEIGWEMFSQSPILGKGIHTVEYVTKGWYTHNNYVELLATTGIIGFVIYYSIFILLGEHILKIDDMWLKIYLSLFVISILMFDLGGVTYYDKLTLLIFILIGYIAERYQVQDKV
jgi:O-antigen ligase